jgi:DNA-binding NarL/FixJ family response regulator
MSFPTNDKPARKKLRLTARQLAVVDAKTTGASRREIAETLGVTPQAVKKRMQRARRRALASLPDHQRNALAERVDERPVRLRTASLYVNPQSV